MALTNATVNRMLKDGAYITLDGALRMNGQEMPIVEIPELPGQLDALAGYAGQLLAVYRTDGDGDLGRSAYNEYLGMCRAVEFLHDKRPLLVIATFRMIEHKATCYARHYPRPIAAEAA